MSINDKDSYGETEMNIPQCHIDTYHNMTKIYIYQIHNINKVC
jgi:hypothetical protein